MSHLVRARRCGGAATYLPITFTTGRCVEHERQLGRLESRECPLSLFNQKIQIGLEHSASKNRLTVTIEPTQEGAKVYIPDGFPTGESVFIGQSMLSQLASACFQSWQSKAFEPYAKKDTVLAGKPPASLMKPVITTPELLKEKIKTHVPQWGTSHFSEGTRCDYDKLKLQMELVPLEDGVMLRLTNTNLSFQGKQTMDIVFHYQDIHHVKGEVPQMGLNQFQHTPELMKYALERLKYIENQLYLKHLEF